MQRIKKFRTSMPRNVDTPFDFYVTLYLLNTKNNVML